MSTSFLEAVKGKKVLFITTKDISYIRNAQEIRILEKEAKSVQKIYSDKKGYIGRILEIWGKLFQLKMDDIEVVFIGFAPQLIWPFYKKIAGKKIIIDFFISVYDTLINDRQKFKARSLVGKFSHWIDSYVIKRADCIIVDTNADAAYFIEEFQGDKDKFETLYLEADNSIYYPREQKKRAALQDKFVVLYFGSILPLQGVDIVLDAVRLLKDQQEIYMQIIGPIPKNYEKPIQDNVEYIDWLPQEELAEYIANADLCLAGHFHAKIDKAKRTIPGKAYIYSNMNKAIILGDNHATRELYVENENTKFVKMGDAKALSDTIKDVCHEKSCLDGGIRAQ